MKKKLLLFFILSSLIIFNSCNDKEVVEPTFDLSNPPYLPDMGISNLNISPNTFEFASEKKFSNLTFDLKNLSKLSPKKGSVKFSVYYSNDAELSTNDDFLIGSSTKNFPIENYDKYDVSQVFSLSDAASFNSFPNVAGTFYIFLKAEWVEDKVLQNNICAPIPITVMPNYYGNGNGQAAFWFNSTWMTYGNITVTVGGVNVGTIIYPGSDYGGCGGSASLSVNIPTGYYNVHAVAMDGTYWDFNIAIVEGQCISQALNP
jgi:hypothetical protein